MGTRARVKTEKQKDGMKVSEVKTVYTDTEVNELLSKGWTMLFAGASHLDSSGFNAKTTFIMGKD